jgi:DNA mismatch endonuclease, patch repair protein
MKLPPAPPPSSATKTMKANRSTGTKPELALRRELFKRGLRYRVGLPIVLPDRRVRPDVVFTRRRVAVFLDGCFWHACPTHGRMPTDPTGYWAVKLARNVDRDAAVTAGLRAAGWTVARIWEHTPIAEAADLVEVALRATAATRGAAIGYIRPTSSPP